MERKFEEKFENPFLKKSLNTLKFVEEPKTKKEEQLKNLVFDPKNSKQDVKFRSIEKINYSNNNKQINLAYSLPLNYNTKNLEATNNQSNNLSNSGQKAKKITFESVFAKRNTIDQTNINPVVPAAININIENFNFNNFTRKSNTSHHIPLVDKGIKTNKLKIVPPNFNNNMIEETSPSKITFQKMNCNNEERLIQKSANLKDILKKKVIKIPKKMLKKEEVSNELIKNPNQVNFFPASSKELSKNWSGELKKQEKHNIQDNQNDSLIDELGYFLNDTNNELKVKSKKSEKSQNISLNKAIIFDEENKKLRDSLIENEDQIIKNEINTEEEMEVMYNDQKNQLKENNEEEEIGIPVNIEHLQQINSKRPQTSYGGRQTRQKNLQNSLRQMSSKADSKERKTDTGNPFEIMNKLSQIKNNFH